MNFRKRSRLVFLAVLSMAAAALFVTLPGEKRLHRIFLATEGNVTVSEKVTETLRLKREGSSVSVETNDQKHSFPEILLVSSGPENEIRPVRFRPRKKGRYIVEFSLFLKPLPKTDPHAYIRQIRGEEIKKIRLGKEADVGRYQLPFRLAGKQIQEAVSIVDVLPTVLDLKNVRAGHADEFDGISLLKAGRGRTGRDRALLACLASNALRMGIPEKVAFISGGYKYIHNKKMDVQDLEVFLTRPPENGEELFDLASDPNERVNIIGSKPELAGQFAVFFRDFNLSSGKRGFFEKLRGRLKSLGYF